VPHNRRDKSGRCDRIAKEEKEMEAVASQEKSCYRQSKAQCFTVVKKESPFRQKPTQRKKMKIHMIKKKRKLKQTRKSKSTRKV
jgi:hypothetical protein